MKKQNLSGWEKIESGARMAINFFLDEILPRVLTALAFIGGLVVSSWRRLSPRQKKIVIVVGVILLVRGFYPSTEEKPKEEKKPEQEHAFLYAPEKGEYAGLINFPLLPYVKQAQGMLEDERAGFQIVDREIYWNKTVNKKTVKVTRTVKKLGDFQILIAAMQISDKKINFVRVFPKARKTSTPGFSVDFEKLNGVNTKLSVQHPKGWIVLAIKRVVQWGKEYKEVVYTPYTPELDISEIRKAGLDYMKAKLDEQRTVLRQQGVKSKAFPGELVVDVVPERVAINLAVIEHVDPYRFKAGEKFPDLVNEVLVTVGANREKAYRYAVSRGAGARGLFQFIRPTYRNIHKQYPKAELIADFFAGMDDHSNAARASLLLFDSNWSEAKKTHRQFLREHPEALGLYLASCYNGSGRKTKAAIEKYGDEWTKHVPDETCIYVEKYDAVVSLLWET